VARYQLHATTSANPLQEGLSDIFSVVAPGGGADLGVTNIDVINIGFIDCTISSAPRIVGGVSTYTRDPGATETIVVDGICTTQTRIGNPGTEVSANIGTATCKGPSGMITCTASGGVCLQNGSTSIASPGDMVTISWSGGDASSGTTMLRVGPSLTTSAPPSTISRATTFTLPISGGSAAILTMTQLSGSTYVSTKCRTPSGASSIVVPASVLALFQPGDALLAVNNESFVSVTGGIYTISVQVDGDTTGPLAGGVDVTLQ
jgi:hypothetical protein